MGTTAKVVRVLLFMAIAGLQFKNFISETVATGLIILAGVFILTSLLSYCPL